MDKFTPAYQLYPKGVAKSLARRLPFVGGLTSLPFMAKIALIARLGVAGARIIMDAPALNTNPKYSPQEKLTSFYERIFIEGGGTLVYHVGMFLGMDVAARLWERATVQENFAKAVHQLSGVGRRVGLQGGEAKLLDMDLEKAFRNFYQSRPPGGSRPTDGLMHLNLYAEDLYGSKGARSHNGFMDAMRERLEKNGLAKDKLDDVMRHVKKSITPLSRSLLRGNFMVQMVGVALGCVLGGVVIQKMNDRIVRPFAMKLAGHQHDKKPDPQDGAMVVSVPASPQSFAQPVYTSPLNQGRFASGIQPAALPTTNNYAAMPWQASLAGGGLGV